MEGYIGEIITGLFGVVAVVVTGYYNSQKQSSKIENQFQKQNLEISGQFEKHLAVIDEKIKSITDKLKDFDMNTMVGLIYDSLEDVWTGRAAAGAVILFIIILVFTGIQFLVSKKRVHY